MSKLFQQKLDEGYDQLNLLVKLDELKLPKGSAKAFIPIDNLFFERSSKGRLERYFDVSQIDEAFEFIS